MLNQDTRRNLRGPQRRRRPGKRHASASTACPAVLDTHRPQGRPPARRHQRHEFRRPDSRQVAGNVHNIVQTARLFNCTVLVATMPQTYLLRVSHSVASLQLDRQDQALQRRGAPAGVRLAERPHRGRLRRLREQSLADGRRWPPSLAGRVPAHGPGVPPASSAKSSPSAAASSKGRGRLRSLVYCPLACPRPINVPSPPSLARTGGPPRPPPSAVIRRARRC